MLTIVLAVSLLIFMGVMVAASQGIDNPMPFAGLVAGTIMAVALWFGPVGRAIARMLEGKALHDDRDQVRIDQIESQLLDQGYDQQRIAELEERLEFAERLLAAHRPQLPQEHTPA